MKFMTDTEKRVTSLDELIHWVREREAIRARKERGDAFPWTDDEVLRTYRFCNVRREDDRVTRWIDANIRRPFADHEHLWFMLCAARAINWPHTLAMLIGDPEADVDDRVYPGAWPSHPGFTPATMGEALEDLASMGEKVFTGAYVITAPRKKGEKKTTFVARETLGNLWNSADHFRAHLDPKNRPTLRSTHARIMRYDGWGPFMAYQAVVDMRFTGILRDATDVRTWAAAGPGTIRGLNWIAGRAVEAPLHQDRALREMLELYPVIKGRAGVDLDLSDVPNVLCETDKYLRVKNRLGAPRALYVPGRGS